MYWGENGKDRGGIIFFVVYCFHFLSREVVPWEFPSYSFTLRATCAYDLVRGMVGGNGGSEASSVNRLVGSCVGYAISA